MRSQGWAPGDYLGAKDASHSEYFSAANASHIKAVLKDDNMGLGAKRNGGDECVGLFDFQALLGRLNGQSDESLDEQRRKHEDAKVNLYLHRKLGTVRFVFAGYLVGDKVQALADEMKRDKEAAAGAGDTTTEGKKEKKSKKRKAEADDDTASEKKTSKKSKSEHLDHDSKADRKAKKEKKRREKEAEKDGSNTLNADTPDKHTADADENASSRKKSKKEKKEKHKKSKDEDTTSVDTQESVSTKEKKKKRKSEKEAKAESSKSSTLPTPIASTVSTPAVPHRHLARQRFIAQKRAAVMDQAALNQVRLLSNASFLAFWLTFSQIFMIKT